MITTPWIRKTLARWLALSAACVAIAGTPARADEPFPMGTRNKVSILCYHEIDDRADSLIPGYSIKPELLADQLAWLKKQGFHFVSVDDIVADRSGRRPLPEKAILLTFDDGYHSFYTHAFPVLKKFQAPAVVALVGHWLDTGTNTIDFDGKGIPRHDFMTWDELRELQASGLVEFASHSYAMHRGVRANPQGNQQPAAITHEWLPGRSRYETDGEYHRRVAADLKRSSDLMQANLGKRPRIIVWPYGRYNRTTREIAQGLGMTVGFNLDDGPNTSTTPLYALRRAILRPRMGIWGMERELLLRSHAVLDNGMPRKVMHVDLDYIYDPDPVQQERNLGLLLDRINAMGVNTIYLQAYSDPDGDGAADAVYFPNRHLPMRADLFNRAAWQISTRSSAGHVYAWMPMLAWQLPASDPAASDRVVTLAPSTGHLSMGYPRLSPFAPRARQAIREIYADLGRSANGISGVLFHDDVTLSDYEDASPWALKTYRKWGFRKSLPELRADDEQLRRWAARKTAWLDEFAQQLAGVLREAQPGLRTARNMYATVVRNPYAETWYSQSLQSSLAHYDYTAVMAMPYMEQATDPTAFYRELVDRVKEHPGAMNRVVFELQSVDWRRDSQPLPGTELADTIRTLYEWGVKNVGYYPDDMFHDNPDPAQLRPVLATKATEPPLEDLLPH